MRIAGSMASACRAAGTGRDYWIGNYVSFGLIGPPDGYQWVRVGDDALLVDVDTGEVLQVEYGVFY